MGRTGSQGYWSVQLSRFGMFFRVSLSMVMIMLSLTAATAPALDRRLATFLEGQIDDKAQLQRTLEGLANAGLDLEGFVLAVFTGKVRMDGSPDNAVMLAHLADYLTRNRVPVDMILVLNMQNFVSVESNRTPARQLFLQRLEALAFSRAAE